ncbi:TRNA pseudouridine synthase A, mitochondrial [Aphelenchoides fujianensis]|nr:TRNA pseudouridine synthase A, mitochondrial [Aphelenchoides fujianensis]
MLKALGSLRKTIMSSASEVLSKEAAADGAAVVKSKGKPMRYAMMLAYQGKKYFGMQIQKDAPTIEGHLMRAMRIYGIITEEEEKKPNMFYFQRAARTDRCVSAVRQLPKDEVFLKDGPRILNEHLPADIRVVGICRTTPSFHAQKTCDSRTYSYTLPTFAFAELDKLTDSKYRITPERIAEINELLRVFVGTHNFFNYTAKRDFGDQSCNRFIISFECGKTFLHTDTFRKQDIEFLSIYIRGQSFMLHQIRKMMGMVIAVIRGYVHKTDIQKSFESLRMDVPKAPGLGLLLERLHYEVYGRKFGKTHQDLNDWSPEIEEEVLRIRDELIVSEILNTECQTQSMMMWLSTLPMHKFACDPEDQAGESVSQLHQTYAETKEKTVEVDDPEEAPLVGDERAEAEQPDVFEVDGQPEDDEPPKTARLADEQPAAADEEEVPPKRQRIRNGRTGGVGRHSGGSDRPEVCAVEDNELASNLLAESNWNLERAVRKFFGNEVEEVEEVAAEVPLQRAQEAPNNAVPPSRRAAPPTPRRGGFFELLSNLVMIPVQFFVWSLREAFNFFVSFFGGPPLPLADPKEEIRRFAAEFREKFDATRQLPWLELPYQQAVNETRRAVTFLVVYLHNPTHARAENFARNYLLSPEFLQFIRENNCLVWGASIRSSEGYKVASALQDTNYPLIAMLCIMNGRMTCVFRMSGEFTLESLIDGMRNTAVAGQQTLNEMRMEQEQRQQNNQLRREQEAEYERSLAADRARKQERQRLESERVEAEKQLEEERQKEAAKQQKLVDHRARLAAARPQEPPAGVVRVAVRFPSGGKLERRFRSSDSLEVELFNAAFAHDQCPADFSLLTSYPPKQIHCAPEWYREFSETAAANPSDIPTFQAAGFEGSWKKEQYALKPMNCPGHCLLFGSRPHTHNELPLRLADFGIDITIKDALRRSFQCATIQLDFQLPQRFDLFYYDEQSEKHRPVIIHRAVLGSVERMTAILTENFAGKWPFWLSPRQAKIIVVHKALEPYALEVKKRLFEAGFEVEFDEDSPDTMNKQVRNAEIQQFNFILVLGQKEADNKTVNVRTRGKLQHGEISLDELIRKFKRFAEEYTLEAEGEAFEKA